MTQHEQIRDLLIGAWELVSWQSIGPDATVDYPLGENAVGQLMYDGASNRVSAQLVRVNQPRFVSDDWQEATSAEMIAAWPNYFGYFGAFSINEAAATVTHHIQSGWFPNLVDTEQIRHYRIEDERLMLDADTAWGRVRIIWRKLAAAV